MLKLLLSLLPKLNETLHDVMSETYLAIGQISCSDISIIWFVTASMIQWHDFLLRALTWVVDMRIYVNVLVTIKVYAIITSYNQTAANYRIKTKGLSAKHYHNKSSIVS